MQRVLDVEAAVEVLWQGIDDVDANAEFRHSLNIIAEANHTDTIVLAAKAGAGELGRKQCFEAIFTGEGAFETI